MQFLNPGLVAGALLFAVPLVIHLLNRQRHKRRDWAAMEFLLRAYQKTRNRLRNENLLLLLLRCLIPIVLAMAIARPVLQSAAGLLGQGGSTHHIVVLDQSYSMGTSRDGAQSPFDKGRAMATRLLESLQASPERADKVTLVLAGVRPRFVVQRELNLAAAKALWQETTRPEDAATDLAPSLVQVAQLLEEGADASAQVHVITDLQTRALGTLLDSQRSAAPQTDGPDFKDTLRDTMDRLRTREGTQVHWIDVSPIADERQGGSVDNVQITSLQCEQPVALARTPLVVTARLQNRGAQQASVQVALDVDGAEPMRKQVVLDAQAEGEAEFSIVVREPGKKRLRAVIDQDALDADNERCAILDVKERMKVLVVDGAADDDPLKTYGWFYNGMLDPQDFGSNNKEREVAGELGRFEVTVCDTLALLSGQQDPIAFDVTVLADVDRINERARSGIERALQAGKGLLTAFGRRADPASYDLQLHAMGEGPMPFRLGQVRGGESGSSQARAAVIALPQHGSLREFDEEVYREILQAVPVWQWLGVPKDSLSDKASVVLRLTDPDQSPLLVTSEFGEGRAAFLLSTPASEYDGKRWNRLEDPFVVFPLLHGLIEWLSSPARDLFQIDVGAELAAIAPARPKDIEVLLPERAGGKKMPLAEEARALPGGRYALPAWSGAAMAGFYTVEMTLARDTGNEPYSQTFAVRVDPAEGALTYAPHADAATALGVDRIHTQMPTQSEASDDHSDDELAPSLLLLTLLLVLGEAAMARYVSVKRS